MPEPQQPLTYEVIMEMFSKMAQETDRRLAQMAKETENRKQEDELRKQEDEKYRQAAEKRQQELDRQFKETDRKIAALGSRVGQIVENMVSGDIIRQFQELGYEITRLSRRTIFGKIGTTEQGEVDLILYDGDIIILIEVKTNLTTDDVKEHVARMDKYRRSVDRPGEPDKHHFIGAVAGAVVEPNVAAFAQKQGFYVIVQSGTAVEIIKPPEGFVAKQW